MLKKDLFWVDDETFIFQMATPWPLMRYGKMEAAGDLTSSEKARANV